MLGCRERRCGCREERKRRRKKKKKEEWEEEDREEDEEEEEGQEGRREREDFFNPVAEKAQLFEEGEGNETVDGGFEFEVKERVVVWWPAKTPTGLSSPAIVKTRMRKSKM